MGRSWAPCWPHETCYQGSFHFVFNLAKYLIKNTNNVVKRVQFVVYLFPPCLVQLYLRCIDYENIFPIKQNDQQTCRSYLGQSIA